jgi:predicted polyphosphate/ATP-dependent NAD kinase
MTDIITVGKVLGLPGAMILVWYLLEKARGERAAKVEEQKIAAENKKTEAMEEGFRSLASMIADHAQADTEAHGKMAEHLAAIESTLSIRKTPPQGVQVREVNRARTHGGDR